MLMKLLLIVSADVDVTDQLFIVRQLLKGNGKSMGQFFRYLQTSKQFVVQTETLCIILSLGLVFL
jgi:hypothetical protein